MSESLVSWIWTQPKTDIHLHLDTSLKPETAVELAKERKISLTDGTELIAPSVCKNLMHYISFIDRALDLLQDEEALQRCAQDLAMGLINDGVVYAEVRFAPELHTKRGLTTRRVIEAVWKGFSQGRILGLTVRLIICALRHLPESHLMPAAQLAVEAQDLGVIAFDCAGDESGLPAPLLKPAFDFARSHGLATIAHAGEARGADSVWEALDILGAVRVGHGVRSIEDELLIQRLVETQIPLEICPTSNIQTGAVASLGKHPIAALLRAGVKVTVNCDGRTTTNTTVTDEYVKLVRHLNMSRAEILKIMENGFDSVLCEPMVKRELQLRFQTFVARAQPVG